MVWEVLKDDTGGDLVFVSQSVETAAGAAFGPPLAARRSAVEPSLDSAPNAIVARVIDDGSVPMGPIVHLSAGSHNVSTLVCRCMPTQAKRLLETGDAALTGKSNESDLLSGKKTLPVLYGLSLGGPFATRWAQGAIRTEDVPGLAAQLEREGGREYTLYRANELTDQALDALEEASPQGEAGEALFALARRLLQREA